MRRAALRSGAFLILFLLTACSDSGGPAAPSPPVDPAPSPTLAPAPGPTATPPPASAVVRSAEIAGFHGHSASGTVTLVRTGGSYTLEFSRNFRIDGGSSDVYLSNDRGSGPGGLNLGRMKATSGAQSYPIPGDGSGYRYVVIWCRPFAITIGFGEFR